MQHRVVGCALGMAALWIMAATFALAEGVSSEHAQTAEPPTSRQRPLQQLGECPKGCVWAIRG
jgi:hypothetical protein